MNVPMLEDPRWQSLLRTVLEEQPPRPAERHPPPEDARRLLPTQREDVIVLDAYA